MWQPHRWLWGPQGSHWGAGKKGVKFGFGPTSRRTFSFPCVLVFLRFATGDGSVEGGSIIIIIKVPPRTHQKDLEASFEATSGGPPSSPGTPRTLKRSPKRPRSHLRSHLRGPPQAPGASPRAPKRTPKDPGATFEATSGGGKVSPLGKAGLIVSYYC